MVQKETSTDTVQTLSDKEDEEEVFGNMSDEEFEDFVNRGGKPSESSEEEPLDEEEESPTDENTKDEHTSDGEESETDETSTEDETEEESDSEEDSGTEEESQSEEDSEETSKDTSEESDNTSEESEEESTEDSTPDYKEAYEKIMKPFKANGKEITPESPEDVVSLMQMGANYVKKMAALKPSRKILKTLENNDIGEDDVQFLIDVKNKDPEAIKKLIKDAEIDPMELDVSEESNYKPKTTLASDKEVDFDQTVSEIQDSPYFETTKQIVTDVWDEESRKTIAENPDLLVKLNEEVELGRYDKVQSIIDRERTFGRLKGVKDLDAYVDIVSNMVKEEQEQKQTQPEQPKETKQKSKPKQPVDKTVNKKAAQPTGKKADNKKVKYTDDEILDMSDDDFVKLSSKNMY